MSSSQMSSSQMSSSQMSSSQMSSSKMASSGDVTLADVLKGLSDAKFALKQRFEVLSNVEISLGNILNYTAPKLVALFAATFPPEVIRSKMVERIIETEELFRILQRILDKMIGRVDHPELLPDAYEEFIGMKRKMPELKSNVELWFELIILRYNIYIKVGI
ncbi:hypothetical protein TNCT_185971 [Trichonephila clavata]|uniref:Uncharacterized protein n=1 Tax=Trichonephila clavata TaxID=2740835 RepID=A0A8X6KYW9_TRICU|nr:hypothetical protein TNCT_185971 [Trichonephila clavata]